MPRRFGIGYLPVGRQAWRRQLVVSRVEPLISLFLMRRIGA